MSDMNTQSEKNFMQSVAHSLEHIDYGVNAIARSMEKMAAAMLIIAKRMPNTEQPQEKLVENPGFVIPGSMLENNKNSEV